MFFSGIYSYLEKNAGKKTGIYVKLLLITLEIQKNPSSQPPIFPISMTIIKIVHPTSSSSLWGAGGGGNTISKQLAVELKIVLECIDKGYSKQ